MARGYSDRSGLVVIAKTGAGKRNGRLRKPARRLRTTPRPKRTRRASRNGRGK